ncbi:MAG: Calx-beta domain-containing protein, partial [Planctomycetota bacterium]
YQFTANGSGNAVLLFEAVNDITGDGWCEGKNVAVNGFVLETASPMITFAASSSGSVETVTPALIAVNLRNPEAGETYTVDYSVIGGTADGNGVDFEIVGPNTLTFLPGETSKIISIDIKNDAVLESDETIVLGLSNATGLDVMLGISEHTYTIADGPPHVFLTSSSGTGSEDSTPAVIQVNLSHVSDEIVTVDYAVTGGTAQGSDVDYYLFEPNALTFYPGEISKNISIDIIDDDQTENSETITLALSNPLNCTLGSPVAYTYTITDNEGGVEWNGTRWYYSSTQNNNLFVNPSGQLEWKPEREQYITRLDDHDLSDVGDVVEISYWWMTDGPHNCPDCFGCDPYCLDDDITCIAGTSDMRVGLFEADGEYVEADGLGTSNSIFNGYKGYQVRFGPNMLAGPTRWVDCTREVHKTGQIKKKDVGFSDLLSGNDHPTLRDLPGFELPPGEWTIFTMRLERKPSSSVEVSMTFNDRTYTTTDSSSSGQPQKIDVLAIYMRNGRPYTRLVLDNVCEGVGDADFDGNDVVDGNDLEILSQDWLMTGGPAPAPDANYLVVQYDFDETSGSTAYDSSAPAYDGAAQVVSTGTAKTNAWDSAGYDGNGCMNFDGNTKVTVSSASTAFAGVNSAVTVSLWVNGDAAVQPDSGWGMAFQAGKSGNDRVLLAHIPTPNNSGVMFESGAKDVQRLFWTSASASDWEGQWNHYVFTVDTAAGQAKIYCNGEKKAERGASTGLGGISSFMVGNGLVGGTNYEYRGKIDDFRVYSYAVSPEEAMSIYTGGGLLLADSPANLYEDEIINFKDFAEFALKWLNVCQ